MRKGWPSTTLGEVCQFRGGGTPSKAVERYWRGDIPWVSPKDMKFDVVSDSIDYISQEAIDGSATSLIPKDSVLMVVRSGILARIVPIAITGRELTINQDLKALCPNGTVDARFLYRLLDSKMDVLLSMVSRGATVHRLMTDQIRALDFALPPLPEQQRIVGILDEAFAGLATAKANAEMNLQNARAIFESHLQSVLRSKKWKWKTLGDLCDGVEYGSSAKSKKEGKVPVLRMGNIQGGQLDWENLAYTDDKEEIAKYLLKHNDVLFNRTNSPELVGKTAIYKSKRPAIFAGYLIRIRRKEDLLDGDFLNYFLNSQIALDYGKTVVISSVNQANINGAKLQGYPIPAPSLSEQRTIVKRLDGLQEETQRLAGIYERKVAALEALKKSLLHEAFTGRL